MLYDAVAGSPSAAYHVVSARTPNTVQTGAGLARMSKKQDVSLYQNSVRRIWGAGGSFEKSHPLRPPIKIILI